MLTCTDAEVESLLDAGQVIAAIQAAFAQGFARVRMPKRVHLELESSTLLIDHMIQERRLRAGRSGDCEAGHASSAKQE